MLRAVRVKPKFIINIESGPTFYGCPPPLFSYKFLSLALFLKSYKCWSHELKITIDIVF